MARIKFDRSGESQLFVATRDVRNSDHQNGTIEKGASVYFRKEAGEISLLYAADGKPTNGNQYVTFLSQKDADGFVSRTGLVELK